MEADKNRGRDVIIEMILELSIRQIFYRNFERIDCEYN